MPRRFSISTLLLVTAVAALSINHVRSAVLGQLGDPHIEVSLVGIGGSVGMLLGLVLAAWNRSGWWTPVLTVPAGFVLGMGAGAQCSMPMSSTELFVLPLVLVVITMLVGYNRRLRTQPRDQRADGATAVWDDRPPSTFR